MKTFGVVTSATAEHFTTGLAGQCFDSFRRYWPTADAELLPYSSDAGAFNEGLKHRTAMLPMPPGLDEFRERYRTDCDKLCWADATYDYRKDAPRFAIKAYALAHAKSLGRHERLIWLDSDVVTNRPVPLSWLLSLDADVVCLDRENHGIEAGFVLYKDLTLIDTFHRMYTQATLFGLDEWHDSYVLRHAIAAHGAKVLNLADGVAGKHVWPKTVLGQYMTHYKGPARKHAREDFDDDAADEYGQVPEEHLERML